MDVSRESMSKIKNTAIVCTYDDKESCAKEITISSHWNRESLVVITIDGKRVTVAATDLKKAVDNCTNVGF